MEQKRKLENKGPEKTDELSTGSPFFKTDSNPASSPVHPVLQLQGLIGNEATTALIQTKLQITQPGDVYEQEADRVAEEVMRMPEPSEEWQGDDEKKEVVRTESLMKTITPLVQRQFPEKPKGEETSQILQQKEEKEKKQEEATHTLQRQAETKLEESKEESLQRKEADRQSLSVSPGLEARIQAMQDGGRPLSDSQRAFFEPRFGANFSGVRIHTDEGTHSLARLLNAHAFTYHQHVFFGNEQHAPESFAGKTLLAHELTHAVQQNAIEVSSRYQAPNPSLTTLPSSPGLNRKTTKLPCLQGDAIIGLKEIIGETQANTIIEILQSEQEKFIKISKLLEKINLFIYREAELEKCLIQLDRMGRFDDLFKTVDSLDDYQLRERLITLTNRTSFCNDPRFVKRIESFKQKRRKEFSHEYIVTDNEQMICLDKKKENCVKPNQVVGDVTHDYIDSSSQMRIKPEQRDDFENKVKTEAMVLLLELATGNIQYNGIEQLLNKAQNNAIHKIGQKSFNENYLEEIEFSLRLIKLSRSKEKESIENYQITCKLQERAKAGGNWGDPSSIDADKIEQNYTTVEFEALLRLWRRQGADALVIWFSTAAATLPLWYLAGPVGGLFLSMRLLETKDTSLADFLFFVADAALAFLGFRGAQLLGGSVAKYLGSKLLTKGLQDGVVKYLTKGVEKSFTTILGGGGGGALITFSHDLVNVLLGKGRWSNAEEYFENIRIGFLYAIAAECGSGLGRLTHSKFSQDAQLQRELRSLIDTDASPNDLAKVMSDANISQKEFMDLIDAASVEFYKKLSDVLTEEHANACAQGFRTRLEKVANAIEEKAGIGNKPGSTEEKFSTKSHEGETPSPEPMIWRVGGTAEMKGGYRQNPVDSTTGKPIVRTVEEALKLANKILGESKYSEQFANENIRVTLSKEKNCGYWARWRAKKLIQATGRENIIVKESDLLGTTKEGVQQHWFEIAKDTLSSDEASVAALYHEWFEFTKVYDAVVESGGTVSLKVLDELTKTADMEAELEMNKPIEFMRQRGWKPEDWKP